MLRVVLLLLYLTASFSWSQADSGQNLDPDGQPAPTADIGGGLDPDGQPAPTSDHGGNLDPNG